MKIGKAFYLIRNGATIKQGKVIDGIPITRIETIADGTVDLNRVGYASVLNDEFIDFYLQDGDILMSHINSVSHLGKVAIFENRNETIIHGMNLLCLRTNSELLLPKYAYLYLKGPQFRNCIKKITKKSVNQASFNISNLKNLEIPVPSISDQLHIANLLTKAENLIAQRKESIRLLDEFLKSTFLEMFGETKGEVVSLTSACIFNPKKSEIASFDKETEVSFVPMASVSETGEVDLSQTRALGDVWTGFTYFKEDDVVFAKITPCMENGKGAIMKNLKNKIGFGTTEFHVLRPIKGVSISAWLYHLTTIDSFRKKAEQSMTGSAGQKRVPSGFFEKYKIVIPPFDLQIQFAQIVDKTEALKTKYKRSLQELENLYGSLSQKAFNGM
jgi:type I restriction enzyme S subunit